MVLGFSEIRGVHYRLVLRGLSSVLLAVVVTGYKMIMIVVVVLAVQGLVTVATHFCLRMRTTATSPFSMAINAYKLFNCARR